MYGIVRCPDCGHIQGVDLSHSSVTCGRCRKRHALSGLDVVGPFDKQDDMRTKIWDMKSVGMNESESYLSREMLDSFRNDSRPRMNRTEKEKLVMDLIRSGSGEYGSIRSEAERWDIYEDELDGILQALCSRAMIYSPKVSMYKVV